MGERVARGKISALPATAERWKELCEVFGPHGCYSGCWCMYWRVKRKDFDSMGTKGRRSAFRRLVGKKEPPGILYYDHAPSGGPVPFGWCSLGPRESFPVLRRSPNLKPVDERPTWSMVCFYLKDEYRSAGFAEIARRKNDRPVLRLELGG